MCQEPIRIWHKIFMTTSTTILSMIPMAFAWGNSGATTQGLALVNIGGLTASTILALLMLPVYYKLMSVKSDEEKLERRRKRREEGGLLAGIVRKAGKLKDKWSGRSAKK